MPEEEFKELSHIIDTNTTGLDHIDKLIYVKMFGYKDLDDYYDKVSICN